MRTLDYIELLFANRSSKKSYSRRAWSKGRGLFYSVSAPDVLIRGGLIRREWGKLDNYGEHCICCGVINLVLPLTDRTYAKNMCLNEVLLRKPLYIVISPHLRLLKLIALSTIL